MKIIEVKCENCGAEFETLENFPREEMDCPSCGGKKLKFKVTKKEFTGGCSGNCSNCSQDH